MAKRFQICTELTPEEVERYKNTSLIFTLRPGQAQEIAQLRREREAAEAAKKQEQQPDSNSQHPTSDDSKDHL